MKYDKSLTEVWGWKEQIYQETKHLPLAERFKYIFIKGEEARKKFKSKKVKGPVHI